MSKRQETPIFENLPELIPADQAAALLSLSRGTLYNWHFDPKRSGVPQTLFAKVARRLYVRRDELRKWVNSRCG